MKAEAKGQMERRCRPAWAPQVKKLVFWRVICETLWFSMFSRNSINQPTSAHTHYTGPHSTEAAISSAQACQHSLTTPAGPQQTWHQKTRGLLIFHCHTLSTSICFVVYSSLCYNNTSHICYVKWFLLDPAGHFLPWMFFFFQYPISDAYTCSQTFSLCVSLCPQLPGSVWVPTDQQPAVNHQSTRSTGCWVSWLTVAAQSFSRLKREHHLI